jgi:hypothetical protein
MYREWKEIKLCWFVNVKTIEGNRIVFVWGCAKNGRKWNYVDLGMCRKWKEKKYVGLGMCSE